MNGPEALGGNANTDPFQFSLVNELALILIISFLIMSWLMMQLEKRKRKNEARLLKERETMLRTEKTECEDNLFALKQEIDPFFTDLQQQQLRIEAFQTEIEMIMDGGKVSAEHRKNLIMERLQHTAIITEENWLEFKDLFIQVYPGFFVRLKEKYPELSQAEIRLLALIRLNMSTREMANCLGVSPETIKKCRYRLRKKINLPEAVALEEIALSI